MTLDCHRNWGILSGAVLSPPSYKLTFAKSITENGDDAEFASLYGFGKYTLRIKWLWPSGMYMTYRYSVPSHYKNQCGVLFK